MINLEKLINESKEIILNEVKMYYTYNSIITNKIVPANTDITSSTDNESTFVDFRKQLMDDISLKRDKADKTLKRWDRMNINRDKKLIKTVKIVD